MVENEIQQELEVSKLNNDEMLSLMKEYVSNDSCNVVFVATDKQIQKAREDEELEGSFKEADLVVSSSSFASDESDQELGENLIDVSKISQITEDEENDKLSVMLITDNLEFSEVFESRIDAMFENFESVGSYLIEYDVDDDLVINEINGRIPDVLVCSFKSPIQEKWIVENKTKMNVKMCVALSGEREDLFSKKETGLKWIAKLFEKSSVFGVTMF